MKFDPRDPSYDAITILRNTRKYLKDAFDSLQESASHFTADEELQKDVIELTDLIRQGYVKTEVLAQKLIDVSKTAIVSAFHHEEEEIDPEE